ncbi:hypothetical protein MW871_10155 [Flavobacterium sp. I-SCBP12n]|uniref:Uncharacterized protein n=1 Tax=Flavobacterium pygoscelis TaxID=2893176 RepID=A0A9X2BLR1_9FLAO|nr:hypothetical protein [Flavobacterium pygoscelis]MCK8142252.1 hypothetical protein [Flavobacterium pygoscelis]
MINLSIYRITLVNKSKEQQVLSFYNEEEDLLETMNDFCSHIHKNIRSYTDVQGKHRTFSLANKQHKDVEKRIITGYFDSAYTGEYGKIKDSRTSHLKYDILKGDLFSKDFFYLIHVPKNSKYGFFVFQKKENHGVKVVFENAFNNFIRTKGVSNFFLELKHAPSRYLITNFFKFGRLKEFRLIDSTVKSNDKFINMNLGREERVIKLNNAVNSEVIKDVLVELFDNFSHENRISFLNHGEFDEISFIITHNGVSKTFYVKDKEKIRASLNVSNMVEFQDGEATFDSLIKICLELIDSAA